MARWGEGDERWIVQERDDGANVNGWHWQEKNCMGWGRGAHRRAPHGGHLRPAQRRGLRARPEISKFEGDASVNTRKGNKKFAVFDLSVTCKWEGECEGVDGVVKGEIKLTEFASANDEDEYEFVVTASDGDAAAKEKFKQKIKSCVAATFQPAPRDLRRELSER